jgi:starch phosphorylase
MPDELRERIAAISDETLWAMRGTSRQRLVQLVRRHLATQLRERGFELETVCQADNALDPSILTIGFARRFTEYKRPNLLLRDGERFARLLLDEQRPLQIVVAGKAHPGDPQGKSMIQEWIAFARQPRYRAHVVFLEDYDIALAQDLVHGVDVWINTPRRPWEACGTSGMKVLVNGGLNCSVLDGWWDEAFAPDLGWAIGDGAGGDARQADARDADNLYETLERSIVPEFYSRDSSGLPRRWLARIRRSMSTLTPLFASTRMARDYVEKAYMPIAEILRTRMKDGCAGAKGLHDWADNLYRHWSSLHIGPPTVTRADGRWQFSVPVIMGEVPPGSARVELFADELPNKPAEVVVLHQEQAIPGTVNGHIYGGEVLAGRPAEDYTVRVVPYHPDVSVPSELTLISWQR